jgi:hypothetical protein
MGENDERRPANLTQKQAATVAPLLVTWSNAFHAARERCKRRFQIHIHQVRTNRRLLVQTRGPQSDVRQWQFSGSGSSGQHRHNDGDTLTVMDTCLAMALTVDEIVANLRVSKRPAVLFRLGSNQPHRTASFDDLVGRRKQRRRDNQP